MARKREERSARTPNKKELNAKTNATKSPEQNFVSFKNQLNTIGLEIKEIPGDGNCLFRALGDQLEGHSKNHLKHREDVVDYMVSHRNDFEPFVEDDVPFHRHVSNLRKPGTYAGNDAIVAFARLHALNVFIHQMNTPPWQINGTEKKSAKQLHISYQDGEHYSSVRKMGDTTNQPTNIRLETEIKASKLSPPNAKKSQKSQPSTSNYYDSDDDFYECYDQGPYTTTVNVGYNHNGGVASVNRTTNDIVQEIKRETGCKDCVLIRETLEDFDFDMDATVAQIIYIMHSGSQSGSTSGLWEEGGTGNRVFGSLGPSTGTKPKQQTSREARKQNKIDKKARAVERHKQRLKQGKSEHKSNSSDDEDAHVVQNLESLVL